MTAQDGIRWIVARPIDFQLGHRGSARAEIQFLCDAGPYEIELVVRETATRLEVTGQVRSPQGGKEPVAGLPVALIEVARATVASTVRTDEFGEFELASRHKCSLGLRLGRGNDSPYVLVWEEDGTA